MSFEAESVEDGFSESGEVDDFADAPEAAAPVFFCSVASSFPSDFLAGLALAAEEPGASALSEKIGKS